MDGATAARSATSWRELCLFLDGSQDSFTGKLLELIAKADPGNRARLREAFPRHVAAWETWQVLAPCTWGELEAAIPERAKRVTVTLDITDPSASFALTNALEEFAASERDMAATEGGNESRTRWADLADRMREQAEAAGS